MRKIKLTQNKTVIVDDIDYDYLMQWKWCYHSGYAVRQGRIASFQKTIHMHQVILTRMGVSLKRYLKIKGNLDYRRHILIPPLDKTPGVKRIPLTRSKFALVDNCDYSYLMQWNWYCSNEGYAIRGNGDKLLGMHIVILKRMGVKNFEMVDHKKRNPLDNRRTNLRSATRSQNNMNQIHQSRKTSSQYKGVTWDKARSKWVAQLKINGKHIYLGRFEDEKEAAQAYNKAAIKYFKEFAYLNKV